MKVHYLKTVQPYFEEVKRFKKKFELRRNDRDFQVGDEVYLQEYDADTDRFSGREIRGKITYILADFIGLHNNFCIFSLDITQHIINHPIK